MADNELECTGIRKPHIQVNKSNAGKLSNNTALSNIIVFFFFTLDIAYEAVGNNLWACTHRWILKQVSHFPKI